MGQHALRTHCSETLEVAGDHLDGLLCAEAAERLRAHLELCDPCARYHRVLGQGLELVRALPEVQPSPDFRRRLHCRLRDVDDEMAERQRTVRSAAAVTVSVAALVALAAWAPLLLPGPRAGALATTAQAESRLDAAPVDARGWWYDGLRATTAAEIRPRANNAFPGPYSPLVVKPPLGSPAGNSLLATLVSSE